MSVLTGLLTALGTDDELSAAWRERFLAPRMAAAKAVFDRAARRGEVRHDLDLELVLTVVPSMCAFRCTVDAQVVDEDFLTRVLDQVLLPAVLARTDQTTLPVHGPPETEGTRT